MKLSSTYRASSCLTIAIFGLLLSGCGGDGESSHSVSVTTNSAGNGIISPASASVDAGNVTQFSITPDAGNVIESVTGCGGTLMGNTYTTGVIQADCIVSVTFTTLPYISVSDAEVQEGDSGTTTLDFTVSLDKAINSEVSVDYAIAGGGTATEGRDYPASSGGTLTINGGLTSNIISVTVNGDVSPEADETLTLSLSNPSANALLDSLNSTSATGTIINDDPVGQLNDTGITRCGDQYLTLPSTPQSDLDCAAVGATQTVAGVDSDGEPVPAGQDAHYGRDATAKDDSDGHAGFSFSYVCNSGELSGEGDCPVDLDFGTGPNEQGCILDNVTGLMWENKTIDNGLRHWSWTYSWYNPDDTTNGGDPGTENGGTCYDDSNCDTDKFVIQVNSSGGICGYSDWRMPTRKELFSITDISGERRDQAVDNEYFPATAYSFFWTSSPRAVESNEAWLVSFHPDESAGVTGGMIFMGQKKYALPVRLVRRTF